jgi:hypothetical protein
MLGREDALEFYRTSGVEYLLGLCTPMSAIDQQSTTASANRDCRLAHLRPPKPSQPHKTSLTAQGPLMVCKFLCETGC